jgi:NarL family two-component system response regulator LiaR
MRKTTILYGIAMAALLFALKYAEYRFFVRDLSEEFYIGFIALLFTSLGIWVGWKLTHRPLMTQSPDFQPDESVLTTLGISKREHEVLVLIAQGLSNNEIAEKLFLSPHTVKSHSSNLFLKLNARRRTEAVKRAKELKILG